MLMPFISADVHLLPDLIAAVEIAGFFKKCRENTRTKERPPVKTGGLFPYGDNDPRRSSGKRVPESNGRPAPKLLQFLF